MRRRRSLAAEAGDAGEVNLTPMLDVVFIML
ncbi:MAG: biopolymer transporter ExbD, partial [Halomonas sp.]